jgi:hypothetical protein
MPPQARFDDCWLVKPAKSPRSMRATLAPRVESAAAETAPLMPAPRTRTSKLAEAPSSRSRDHQPDRRPHRLAEQRRGVRLRALRGVARRAPQGEVQHLGAVFHEPARDLQGLVEVDALRLTEVLGREAHRQHQRGRRGLHRTGHLPQEPRAAREVTAPPVGAAVVRGAQELREQVAVGAVQLHAVEARVGAAAGGGGEVGDDPREVLFGPLAAHVALVVGVGRGAPGGDPAHGL